ncbi:hypothetical protein ACISSW_22310, partial [Escherichia coli]
CREGHATCTEGLSTSMLPALGDVGEFSLLTVCPFLVGALAFQNPGITELPILKGNAELFPLSCVD